MEDAYQLLAYKAPTDNGSLRLVSLLESDLSKLCQAATWETLALSPGLARLHVGFVRSRLQELKSIWGCVVDNADVSDDESRAAQNHVMRLFTVNHGCLPLLLTAHAWALRASSPCRDNQIAGIDLLLMDLQFAVRVVLAAKPLAPVDAPLLRTWETIVTAFQRTQPLHAASAVLHAHRQRLASCRVDPAAELAALGQAADAWTGALELAASILGIQTDSDCTESTTNRPAVEVAPSHILQHLCALRLDLAEGLARAGEGDGEEEEEGGGGAAVAAEVARVTKQLEGRDAAMLEAIASAGAFAQIGGSFAVARDMTVFVHFWTPEPSSSEMAMRSALSHPAVQCLLGWWLVAPREATDGGGGRAWGLPEALHRHVRDMAERDKLCVHALKAAAQCWESELRLWQGPPSSQRSGAAAAAASAQGLERETAAPSMPPGAAAATALLAATGTSAGAHATSIAHALQHRAFPYSPIQIYRMCSAAFRTCLCLAEQGNRPIKFHMVTAAMALKDGLGVLIGCLLHMPPAQSARRLVPVWRLLLRAMWCGPFLPTKTAGWCMARLLGELPPRLQQQQQGKEDEGLQQQRQGREKGGLLPQQQQRDRLEMNAGGVVLAIGGEETGSGPSSNGGGGAADQEPTGRPSSLHEEGEGGRAAHVVACALDAGLLPALEDSIRQRVRLYQQHAMLVDFSQCAELVDLALRRPGCWLALLAHGDPRQAAALVVSLGKAARAEEAAERAQAERRSDLGTCSLLQLELLALLEQLGPRPCGAGVGGGGGAAAGGAAASGSAGSAGGRGAGAGVDWPDLRLNRGVGGVERKDEKGPSAEPGTSGGGSSGSRAGSKEGGSNSSGGGSTPPAWAAGPTWQQVAAAGGCPAPGTPPQLQLARLTALAAAEWLPVLITRPPHPAAAAAARAPRAAAGIPYMLPHKAYRVAWAWLRLVARQVLVFAPDGSCTVHTGWASFLVDRLNAIDQLRYVLAMFGLRSKMEALQLTQRVLLCLAAAREVLPCALGVLEVVALAAPEQLREALVEELPNTAGTALAWAIDVLQVVQGQPDRQPLAGAVRELAAAEWTGGAGACRGPVWDELRRVVQLHVCREGLPLLPGPHVHGDVGLPRCANAWCTRVEGPSEAGVRLQACGRCRAVGYCCAECQRADWAAGHKAACGRAGAGAKVGAGAGDAK